MTRTTDQWAALHNGISHPEWTATHQGNTTTIHTPYGLIADVYPDGDEFGFPDTGDADAIAALPDALDELVRLRMFLTDQRDGHLESYKSYQERIAYLSRSKPTNGQYLVDLEETAEQHRRAAGLIDHILDVGVVQ